MKHVILTAIGASLLFGTVAASAQGLPPGTVPPVYGAKAFPADRQALTQQKTLSADSGSATDRHGANTADRNARPAAPQRIN